MRSLATIVLFGVLALSATFSIAAEAAGGPPAHKKWKLVFADEFDGPSLDMSKWNLRCSERAFNWKGAQGRRCDDHAAVDGQGHFVVRVTRDADGVYCYHPGVDTKGKFQLTYGYVETRSRFTRQPGWWGAVWLYGVEVGPNPFVMGQEIDIFEDFYKPKTKFDFSHNLHFDAQLTFAFENNRRVGKLDGNVMHRVSRGSPVLVDDWDAFHVVAVEWTPLEYIFYCDGRETCRWNYKEVPVTTQPMQVLISGCFREPRPKAFFGDYTEATWPDQLTVDYVRVYEEDLAGRQKPQITVRTSKPVRTVARGEDVTFEVSASETGGEVKDVLLFDNGRIRGEKSANSATFTVAGSQLYIGDNVIVAMARDSEGLIGISEPLTVRVHEPIQKPSKPYEGRAQTIPGHIVAGHYDEGGQGVAYGSYLKDNVFGRPPWNLKFRTSEGIASPNASGIGASHRGLWVNYTVQVQKSGDYRLTAFAARPDAMQGGSPKPDRISLEIDNEPLADVEFSSQLTTGKAYWANYQPLPAQTVRLAEGTHVLRVRFDCTPFNFGGLEFVSQATGDQR
jgi:beta-glucanase (GH16 family)